MKPAILKRLPLIVAFVLFLSSQLQAQPSEASPRLAAELSRIEQAREYGAQAYPVTFSTYNLFWRTGQLEIDEEEAWQDERILAAVGDAGLTPMGVFPTWLFPPSAQAALTPPSHFASFTDAPEALISCVPDLDGSEYGRLIQLRGGMVSLLARRFPSVRFWIVGYEPDLPFFDCSGRQLDLPSMIVYIADTLKSVREALRQVNSDTLVVAHFLGASGIPIEIRAELVQPSEILAGLAAEIERRGDSAADYYDLSITDFVPSLALDRFPEPTTFVPFSHSASLQPRRAAKVDAEGHGPDLVTGNWSTSPYWADYFSASRSTLSGSGTDWNEWRTDTDHNYIKSTPVNSGQAHMVMGAPPVGKEATVLGGVTKPTVDVIPDEHFGSSGFVSRNRWIAVMDFYPSQDPNPNGIHAGVFLRVNDREWNGLPDQTRFGSVAWGGYLGDPTCGSSYCGALELLGDDANYENNSVPKLKLVNFTLSEFPWSFSSHLYRIQILEEERFDPLNLWQVYWRAEVVDLSDQQTVGSSNWFSEWSVLNNYGIKKPGLTGSKLAIGFGPGQDQPFAGAVDADLVGTAYWIY